MILDKDGEGREGKMLWMSKLNTAYFQFFYTTHFQSFLYMLFFVCFRWGMRKLTWIKKHFCGFAGTLLSFFYKSVSDSKNWRNAVSLPEVYFNGAHNQWTFFITTFSNNQLCLITIYVTFETRWLDAGVFSQFFWVCARNDLQILDVLESEDIF